jgi:hypothetical protein
LALIDAVSCGVLWETVSGIRIGHRGVEDIRYDLLGVCRHGPIYDVWVCELAYALKIIETVSHSEHLALRVLNPDAFFSGNENAYI